MAEETTVVERPEVVRLRLSVPDALLKVKESHGDTYLCLAKESLTEAMTLLRDEFDYRYFVECMGVDYSRWIHDRDLDGRFEVVYNLFNIKTNGRLFVKVAVNDGEKVPSMIPVWAGAEYPEREITDLFGVIFAGNEPTPGERFLLPDDWVGFPLRKEYPLGGDDVLFDRQDRGPAVEDLSSPHAGESFEGKTGSSPATKH